MELLSQFLNSWQAPELGIFRKSINLLSFLCSNHSLSISISVFHLFIFLVVNIVIYVHQSYSTTINFLGVAARFAFSLCFTQLENYFCFLRSCHLQWKK